MFERHERIRRLASEIYYEMLGLGDAKAMLSHEVRLKAALQRYILASGKGALRGRKPTGPIKSAGA